VVLRFDLFVFFQIYQQFIEGLQNDLKHLLPYQNSLRNQGVFFIAFFFGQKKHKPLINNYSANKFMY